MANPSGESSDYKLTDLDYLIGDHHLQMIKAALPFLEVPEQKAVSVFVKAQELKNTLELFETEEIASMGICSLEEPQSRGCQRAFKGDTALWNPTGTGSNRSGKSLYRRADPHGTAAPSPVSRTAGPF